MRPLDRNWPPLIIARHKSFWVTLRDMLLTTLMWIVFAVMLEGEFGLLFPSYVERLGLRAWLERIGFGDLSVGINLPGFALALVPYLGISLILIVSLLSFAIDTINRRRAALRGPRPPPLDPAIQAHHAELSTMAGYVGPATKAQPIELSDDITFNIRHMLAVLDQRDEAALADVRSLRIARVHVTPDGHYRILPADGS